MDRKRIGEKERMQFIIILYEKQKGFCLGCTDHFKSLNLSIDHIIPQSKGGSNDIKNLQLLCQACNSFKHNRIMTNHELRKMMNRTPEQIREDKLALKRAAGLKYNQKRKTDPIIREKFLTYMQKLNQKQSQKLNADPVLKEKHCPTPKTISSKIQRWFCA